MDSYRDRARRRTRRVQGLAVVLLACAGAAAALPLPRLFEPAKWAPPQQPMPPTGPLDTGLGAAAPIDTKKMAEVLVATAGKPAKSAVPTPPEKVAEGPPKPEPGAGPTLRYLGWVAGPKVKAANLALDIKQKFVAEGSTINGLKLVSIEADHVMLESASGAPQRIDLAPPALNWSPDSPSAQVPGPQPGQPWLEEEKRRYLESQRLKGQPPTYPPGVPAPMRPDMAPSAPGKRAPIPPGKEPPKDGA